METFIVKVKLHGSNNNNCLVINRETLLCLNDYRKCKRSLIKTQLKFSLCAGLLWSCFVMLYFVGRQLQNTESMALFQARSIVKYSLQIKLLERLTSVV